MDLNNSTNTNVVIIDYGLGNLFSIKRACEVVGLSPIITSSKEEITRAKAIILPGVGAFWNAMESLKTLDLVELLQHFGSSNTPIMAICLGMQLLMSESSEYGRHQGLNVVKGKVKRLNHPDQNLNGKRLKGKGDYKRPKKSD